MSVGWMILVAALIVIEKLLPWRQGRDQADLDRPGPRRRATEGRRLHQYSS
jgi:hypothetical protein